MFAASSIADARPTASAKKDEPVVLVGPPRTGVYAMALSPDGRTLVVGLSDYTAQIWDLVQRRRLATLSGAHRVMVNAVAVTDDGTLVATGGGATGGRVVLWRRDGTRVAVLGSQAVGRAKERAHRAPVPSGNRIQGVNALAFSPNGKLLLSGHDGATISLWDVGKRELQRTIRREVQCGSVCTWAEHVRGVGFYSDQLFAVALYNQVEFFHARSGKPLGRDTCHNAGSGDGLPVAMAFGPKRRFAAVSYDDGNVRLVAASRWCRLLSPQKPLKDAGHGVAFLPGGTQVVAHGRGARLSAWSIRGRLLKERKLPNAGVRQLALTPKGELITAGAAPTIDVGGRSLALWPAQPGVAGSASPPLAISKLHFSADGASLDAAGRDGRGLRWEVAHAKVVARHARTPLRFAERVGVYDKYSAAGGLTKQTFRRLVGIAKRLDEADQCTLGDCERPYVAASKTAVISSDRRVIAYVSAGRLRLVGLTAAALRALRQRAATALLGFVAPGSRWLAVAADKGLGLFDLTQGKRLGPFADHGGEVVAATTGGPLFAASDKDGDVIVWQVATRKIVWRRQPGGAVVALALDHAGRQLAVATSDGSLRVYRMPGG